MSEEQPVKVPVTRPSLRVGLFWLSGAILLGLIIVALAFGGDVLGDRFAPPSSVKSPDFTPLDKLSSSQPDIFDLFTQEPEATPTAEPSPLVAEVSPSITPSQSKQSSSPKATSSAVKVESSSPSPTPEQTTQAPTPEPTPTATQTTPAVTATPTPTQTTATPTPTPTPTQTTTTPAPPKAPVLKNLGVAFGRYNAMTGRAGGFDFWNLQKKPFVDFGDNGVEPTFTYLIAEDAQVTAVADGYVQKVEYQATYQDYSILANTQTDGQGYSIDYDHVLNPTVSAGQQLTAGQVIGIAGTHSDLGIGRLEIQVFLGGQSITNYCPFTFFEPTLLASYKQQLKQLMLDYETYMFNPNVYDDANYTASGHTGCRVSTLAE